ncbi:MAG: hypothetical protein ACTHMC_01340 [Pseudobacter sp.]|uniref:hypothetical protein n=1 Tax=Pseudobacter sp. TaxID=2045420 RepID=UPI003F7F1208
MNPANRQFLDDNRGHYITLVQAQYIQHLDGATRDRLLQVVQEEFDPGYNTSLWCGTCVADLLRYAYRRYDEWLTQNQSNASN